MSRTFNFLSSLWIWVDGPLGAPPEGLPRRRCFKVVTSIFLVADISASSRRKLYISILKHFCKDKISHTQKNYQKNSNYFYIACSSESRALCAVLTCNVFWALGLLQYERHTMTKQESQVKNDWNHLSVHCKSVFWYLTNVQHQLPGWCTLFIASDSYGQKKDPLS